MIELTIQLKMIIFSFIYGIILSFLLKIIENIIYHNNNKIKIICTFTFFLLNTFIYFLCLKNINNALIDHNLLLMLILGIYLGTILRKVLIKILKH